MEHSGSFEVIRERRNRLIDKYRVKSQRDNKKYSNERTFAKMRLVMIHLVMKLVTDKTIKAVHH